ncbi:hypothetical protein D0864_00993 [Hortaea werneckii]|uniref:Btz domain-containing protein n=1 Tax=Hortaea werneckii TaxID=91943 RepID=A0A3M7HE12_HORWE|nr:hypothetical protein D0864_00993 [Hortaea werneckii]
MAAGRTLRSLVSRRRRADSEGEDEEGPVIVNDSQSEGSVLSDAEDDDVSTAGDTSRRGASPIAVTSQSAVEVANGANPPKEARNKPKSKKAKEQKTQPDGSLQQPSPPAQAGNFKAMADTEAMMKGLRIGQDDQQEAIDFEGVGQNGSAARANENELAPVVVNGSNDTPTQRQRRDHEDYRKKRDADPAFIPNRGNFFMHDTRAHSGGQAPVMRGGWSGRGRGRGGPTVGGPFSPANQMVQNQRAAQQPWKHDLHDTINEEPTNGSASVKRPESPHSRDVEDNARLFPKAPSAYGQGQHRILSFSSTTLVGKVQIRVLLPGMNAPITFSEVPWKNYIRLPNHRPPLRRDKPVRVSLPDRAPQYIFPSTDRSFIFIPRQNRPAQQGFRSGSYQRSVGGYGYSSRRTSMYGGSMYASSVAASRRSSMAAISRADAFSPTSFASAAGMGPASRPVVRLPHGTPHFSAVNTPSAPMSGHQTPVMQTYTYPLPQQPTFQGTPTSTVHQPRPQKAISVTGIESPALLQQQDSSTEPLPFQNQLPSHMEQQNYAHQQPYFSPRQPLSYSSQPQIGTPLSGIPEQAVHAPHFQAQNMPYGQPPYYPQYPPQQPYYYSPPGPNGYQQMPMYMPPQGYMIPQPMPPHPPHQPEHQQHHQHQGAQDQDAQHQQSQSGMVAQERNGMVFYVPQSEAQDQGQGYQPAEGFVPSYAMPGLPPPTPAPDANFYYPQPMYHGAPSQQ